MRSRPGSRRPTTQRSWALSWSGLQKRAPVGSAEYEFKGARLLRYSGAPIEPGANVELRMDVNGKVLSAMAGSQSLSPEQISKITSRAQLLRSHALAQAATRNHQ